MLAGWESQGTGEKYCPREGRALGPELSVCPAPFVLVQGLPGSLWWLMCFPVDLGLGVRTGAVSWNLLGIRQVQVHTLVIIHLHSVPRLISLFPLVRKQKLEDAGGSLGSRRSRVCLTPASHKLHTTLPPSCMSLTLEGHASPVGF